MSFERKSQTPEVDALQIPRDSEGPVFKAPWESHAFAIAIALRDQSILRWPEFADYLSAEIAAAGQEGDGRDYYRHWLRAVERLLLDKRLMTAEEFSRYCAKISAMSRHEHSHQAAQPTEQLSDH